MISSLQEGAIFLDTFMSTYNNNLSIGIYRKPTHSNRVLITIQITQCLLN